MQTTQLMMDLMTFFGPEDDYQRYMAMRIEQELEIAGSKPTDDELEAEFERLVKEYKQKTPDFKAWDIVVFELAFFKAAKYFLTYK